MDDADAIRARAASLDVAATAALVGAAMIDARTRDAAGELVRRFPAMERVEKMCRRSERIELVAGLGVVAMAAWAATRVDGVMLAVVALSLFVIGFATGTHVMTAVHRRHAWAQLSAMHEQALFVLRFDDAIDDELGSDDA